MVAIIAIYRLNLKYPDANTIVVVPSIKLHKDWLDNVETFNLKNVKIYVINTYTSTYLTNKVKWKCELLIVDEVHNALSLNGIQFNQTITCTDYKMFLGLSATLNDEEKNILEKLNIPIIDTVTMSEASRFNYISNYIVYNYGIELNTDEYEKYTRLNDIHNSNYAKFRYFQDSTKNWHLAQACGVGNNVIMKVGNEYRSGKEWREWYSTVMSWDGTEEHVWSPKNISKYANQWNWAMRERKNFLYKNQSKIESTVNIVNFLNVPTITFAETTEFADELVAKFGNKALAYHTNLKAGFISEPHIEYRKQLVPAKNLAKRYNGKLGNFEEGKGYPISFNKEKKVAATRLRKLALTKFENKEISVLCTAKALDEGFNVEGIECAIICSASSQRRQSIQRINKPVLFKLI